MASMPPSLLLSLPQELRDMIYSYVVGEALLPPDAFEETTREHIKPSIFQSCLGIEAESEPFRMHWPESPPRPSWHSLILTCQQINTDFNHFFASSALRRRDRGGVVPPPTMRMDLTRTASTVSWTHLPCSPQMMMTAEKTLRIDIRLTHIWDRGILSTLPQLDNKIIHALFHTLKRYLANGPHLTSATPLEKPLQLDTLILDIAPVATAGEAACYEREVKSQLALVYKNFHLWMLGMCMSGVLGGKVGKVRMRMWQGKGEWDEIDINVVGPGKWCQFLGYKW